MKGYMESDTMLDIIWEVQNAVESNTLTEAHMKRLRRVIARISNDIDILEKIAAEQPTKREKAIIARCTSKYIGVWGLLENVLESLTDYNKTDTRQTLIRLDDAFKMIEERL